MKIKRFNDQNTQVKWFADNLDKLKAARRADAKKTDAFHAISYVVNDKGERVKADGQQAEMPEDNGVLKIRVVVNTTNLFDSHYDVHAPGIWKKTLKDGGRIFLCYEHDLSYKGILSDTVKASTELMDWSALGQPYQGQTEALVFDCLISKEQLEEIELGFMYNRYKTGRVYNHSVRMRAVKEYFCCKNTDPEYTQYNDNYEKYIDQVANKDAVEASGDFFWYVTEAQLCSEGSAVVRGSNQATPVLDVEEEKTQAAEKALEQNKNEPPAGTQTGRRRLA